MTVTENLVDAIEEEETIMEEVEVPMAIRPWSLIKYGSPSFNWSAAAAATN